MNDLQTFHAEGDDYVVHEQTYRSFLTVVKWATVHVIVFLVLMAVLLLRRGRRN